MIDPPNYYARDRRRWEPYDGERIAIKGWRAVVADQRDFDREGRVFAYVEPDAGGTFLAWHERPEPGETVDVKDGLWRTLESAKRAAWMSCLADLGLIEPDGHENCGGELVELETAKPHSLCMRCFKVVKPREG
jgi:hypothetical protein